MKRRAYTPIRIDFTPFVNVALLLIVFFVWQKTRQRLNLLPIETGWYSPCFPDWTETKVLVIYLGGNDKVNYIISDMEGVAERICKTNYSETGLRNLFKKVLGSVRKENLLVFIKPNKLSTLKNLTMVIQEINRIGKIRYGIDEASRQEQRVVFTENRFRPGRTPVLTGRQ